MKVLQVNAYYRFGSTGKIVYDISSGLIAHGYLSVICYGHGKKYKEPGVYRLAPEAILKLQALRSRITGYAYAGCHYSTNRLISIIQAEKPDVVHLHCINGYVVNIYRLLDFLKNRNIKTVITMHAEFMYTAGCGYAFDCEKWKYGCGKCSQLHSGRPHAWLFDRTADEWKKMKSSFEGFENLTIVAVSKWLCNRAKQSPFFCNKKLVVIENGIDTENIFHPLDYKPLKIKLGLTNEKVVLYVTPNFFNPTKGGEYVLQLAERFKSENVRFLIVGYQGSKNILPDNVIPIAYIDDQKELAAYYSMANVTLLTSKRETFSMVCAESLSCGTPVVGFEAGAPETIALQKFSTFVKYGDLNKLEFAIRDWIFVKDKRADEISSLASNRYSRNKMMEKYIDIYTH